MSTIYDRALADKNVSESEWLEARRLGVTATEVRDLAKKAKSLGALANEKRSGKRTFFGSQATEWGLEREQLLVDSILKPEGFFGSDVLYHAENNKRHLATPDALYLSDGTVSVAEIKTSKHDISPGSSYFENTNYYDQMQFQMYVVGDDCMECLYVWEQHVDYVPFPAQKAWIKRDQKRIEELIVIADEFLRELDSTEEVFDIAAYDEVISQVLLARAQKEKYAAIEAVELENLRELIGNRGSLSLTTGLAKVSLSTPKPAERFDSAAFKSAQPDVYSQFLKVSQSKPSLRITALKEGNDVF